jgi:DNA-binding MarR family transcriptional regulator
MASTPESVRSRVGYLVKQLQHAFRAAMDERLAEIGLSASQYALLTAIEEGPGASGADLARRCFITPQSVNGLIASLQSEQLIERAPSATHGRVIETKLSKRGAARLKLAHRCVAEIEDKMLKGLEPSQRLALAELLRQCIDSIER